MKVELKTWTGLGVATALAGLSIAGCSGEAGEGGEGAGTSVVGESGEAGEGGEGGEGGEAGALPVEQRLVFMAGHVEAGLALFRAGESKAAAPHLLHPVSETHEAEREGLDDLGFDPVAFAAVSTALDEGIPASEIEPQLERVEANLARMRGATEADGAEQIRFLMETAAKEYAVAVNDGKVTDAAEYQDAWGFVKVARDIAADLEVSKATAIRNSLDEMLALWPADAPIPPEQPAPAGQVSALASRVLLDLPQ